MSFKMYNPGYKLTFIHYSNSAFFDIVAAAEIDYHLLEKCFTSVVSFVQTQQPYEWCLWSENGRTMP